MKTQKLPSVRLGILLYVMAINLLVIALAISGRLLLNWPPLQVFHVYFYGAQLGLVLALLAFLQFFYGLLKKSRPHIKTAGLTVVLALLPLSAALVSVGLKGFKAPMIHDISTDMVSPPEFSIISSLRTAEENSLEYAGESIAAEQRRAYPDIQALFAPMSPEQARLRALETIRQLGWVLVLSDQSTGNIEAYDSSGVFGFIDDVVIRIQAASGGSIIDVRSVSRVGKGDLGANAQRIRQFFHTFSASPEL